MVKQQHKADEGEFLWLVSLSDLMILLFIFFVVMFSAAYKKIKQEDLQKVMYALRDQKPPDTPIDVLYNHMNKLVQDQKLQDVINVTNHGEYLQIDILDKVLFESGHFNVHPAGVTVLQKLAYVIEKVPDGYQVGIEGHTDDVPMHTKLIHDNWELSSKRALSVLYSMGLSPRISKRTTLMSHAEMKPIVPNRDEHGRAIPQNQAKNRRVTLRVNP